MAGDVWSNTENTADCCKDCHESLSYREDEGTDLLSNC